MARLRQFAGDPRDARGTRLERAQPVELLAREGISGLNGRLAAQDHAERGTDLAMRVAMRRGVGAPLVGVAPLAIDLAQLEAALRHGLLESLDGRRRIAEALLRLAVAAHDLGVIGRATVQLLEAGLDVG